MTGNAQASTNRRPVLTAALAWLALLAGLAAPVGASAPRDTSTLVMGGDANYAPFQYNDAKGLASGFDAELMRAVAASQELTVHIELGNWDETLQRLARGEVDVVPMFISAPRAKRFLFTEPYLMRYHLVFGRSSDKRVASLEDLARSRVAVQRAGLAFEALQSVEGVTLVPTDEEPDTLWAVVRGEADYALAPTGIGYGVIRREGLDLVALSQPLLERPYAFAVRRDRPALVERLNAGLREVHDNGTQDDLYVKWIGNFDGGDAAPRWLAWTWLAVPLLLSALLLSWWRFRPHRALAAGHDEASASDPLTHLPDRAALLARLEDRIVEWRPGRPGFGLARIHLQGLEMIEDIAGEPMLDAVRIAVAERLLARYGTGNVSVLGSGSLAVVLPAVTDRACCEAAMEEMAALLGDRMEVGELPVELRSRIGVTVFPADATEPIGLVRAARIACEMAQKRGVNGLCYDAGFEPDPRNLTLMAELREAIDRGELGYVIQPKRHLRSGRWIGAELLVRWNHAQHGPLLPANFVPLAEQTHVIGAMSLYLVGCGLAHALRWQRQERDLTISVNVAANDLAEPKLLKLIEQADSRGRAALILEVTETDVMRDPDLIAESVARLRALGVRVSVDDFGTGHSSLTNLRRLAPDEIKIDRSFVQNLVHSPSDQAIVRACIRLGHDLGTSVTAEGIEDEATLRWLCESGCDAAQGYHIARPMEPAQFERLLEDVDAADPAPFDRIA